MWVEGRSEEKTKTAGGSSPRAQPSASPDSLSVLPGLFGNIPSLFLSSRTFFIPPAPEIQASLAGPGSYLRSRENTRAREILRSFPDLWKACCTVCSDGSDGASKEAPWNQIMDITVFDVVRHFSRREGQTR